MEPKLIEGQGFQIAAADKKVYAEPVLEKRELLVEVTEDVKVVISGVANNT